jgi:hypothetical protein
MAAFGRIPGFRNGREDDGLLPASASFGGTMTKRGKVLRDTNVGPGLLSIDGQHVQFSLEGVWRSEMPPVPGMAVQVEFAPDGSIVDISAISDSQIAKQQAGAVVDAARQQGKILASAAVSRFGLPTLTAAGMLMIGWFFLSAASIQTLLGKADFTFWQLLGFLNSTSAFEYVMQGRTAPSAGFYGFLALAALAGPFVPYFWKDRRASLAGTLPLLFMLMAGVMLRSSINSAIGGDVGGPIGDMARQAREEAMKAISIGYGSYLSALACLYFAGVSVKNFLLARGLAEQAPAGPRQLAV